MDSGDMVEAGSPSRSSDVLPVAGPPRAVTMGLAAVRTVPLRRPRCPSLSESQDPSKSRHSRSRRCSATGNLPFGRRLRQRPDARMKPSSGFKPLTSDPSLSSQIQESSLPWIPSWEFGLQKAARGDLARQITLAEETEAKDGRLLKGRQILTMVYESHNLDEAIGQVFDIENIFNTTLEGDTLANFLQD